MFLFSSRNLSGKRMARCRLNCKRHCLCSVMEQIASRSACLFNRPPNTLRSFDSRHSAAVLESIGHSHLISHRIPQFSPCNNKRQAATHPMFPGASTIKWKVNIIYTQRQTNSKKKIAENKLNGNNSSGLTLVKVCIRRFYNRIAFRMSFCPIPRFLRRRFVRPQAKRA